MSSRSRRGLALALALCAIGPVALLAQPAGAAFPKGDSVITFNYKVKATTVIKKINQTISPPQGVFKGGIDLDTRKLQGSITLPPTTFTYSQSGVPVMTATASLVQVKPVTGTVNLGTLKVTATSVFNIRITSAYAAVA